MDFDVYIIFFFNYKFMYICSLVAKNRWDTQKPESDTC